MLQKILSNTIMLVTCSLLVSSCQSSPPQNPPKPVLSLEETANRVLQNMQAKDMDALGDLAHPTKGVRFTPYTHVQMQTDRTYPSANIRTFFSDTSIYTWGIHEGSGEPIELSGSDYWKRFVWDHDYTTAPEMRFDHVQDYGSMIDNAAETYPGSKIVEYHFPGFDPQYGGMDWRSLRLVLEEHEGNWFLTGVIHDEWTP